MKVIPNVSRTRKIWVAPYGMAETFFYSKNRKMLEKCGFVGIKELTLIPVRKIPSR